MCERGLGGDQSWEDYGFEILEKSPGLYKVPKLRNLNFCCCTVCFLCLGGVWRGWVGRRGFQRRKDYGLEVLAKTPGLYQVPMLRNVSCIINFAKTALSTHGAPPGHSDKVIFWVT